MTALDDLKLLDIFNPALAAKYAADHGIEYAVTVVYQPGAAYQSAAWQVLRHGYRTDRDAGHLRGFNKTFHIKGAGKAAAAEEAKVWAGERYGVTEWVKIPGLGGNWFPREVADLIKADVRAAKKAVK